MFFFKRKKIVLDCFTSRQDVFDYSKIDYARKFYPEWWKKVPKQLEGKGKIFWPLPTIKKCTGLIQHYQNGVIIPLWSDCAIKLSDINGDYYQYQFSDRVSEISIHPSEQRGDFADPKHYQHFKFISPWLLSCKENVKWMFIQPTWNDIEPDKITVLPGTLDFSLNNASNINFVMRKEEKEKTIILEHGTPLAHIIPISEREVDLRLHKVSQEEYSDLIYKQQNIKFTDKYNVMKKIVKPKKCPFGFGK